MFVADRSCRRCAACSTRSIDVSISWYVMNSLVVASRIVAAGSIWKFTRMVSSTLTVSRSGVSFPKLMGLQPCGIASSAYSRLFSVVLSIVVFNFWRDSIFDASFNTSLSMRVWFPGIVLCRTQMRRHSGGFGAAPVLPLALPVVATHCLLPSGGPGSLTGLGRRLAHRG